MAVVYWPNFAVAWRLWLCDVWHNCVNPWIVVVNKPLSGIRVVVFRSVQYKDETDCLREDEGRRDMIGY